MVYDIEDDAFVVLVLGDC
nr:hypothetical protein [Rhodococcus sp. p52]